MLNKEALLQKKYNHKIFQNLLIFIPLILIIAVTYKIKSYDLYPIYAEIIENDFLKITLNYEDLEYINQDTKIKYHNQYYDIKDISYGDIYIEGNIPYETITINTNLNLNGEKLVKINLANNYKRIIIKIKENILGGK